MARLKSTDKSEPATFAETVIPLMKEYTSKLKSAIRELREFREQGLALLESRVESPQSREACEDQNTRQIREAKAFTLEAHDRQLCTPMQNLLPPATQLGQHVSQRISHADLGDLEKIDLSLRLAELESAVSVAQDMIVHNLPYHLLS